MSLEEYLEFLIMLLIEDKCTSNESFFDYIDNNCSIDKFNNRYDILLDKFLNKYALNKTEKSD